MPRCPHQCGECCEHDNWLFLFKDPVLERGRRLREATGWKGTTEEAWEDGKCLFHSEKGCILPRSQRPGICNNYLCDRAIDGLRKEKTCLGKQPRPSREEASASPARSSSAAR